MKIDYIIVGQGIAGTLLTHFLLVEKQKIIVVDDDNNAAASRIAAGIFNPITGRRMVKTWMADTLFPFAEKTYRELEKRIDRKVYFKKNVIKFFSSVRDQNDWLAKTNEPEFDSYVKSNFSVDDYQDFLRNQYGGVEIQKSGFVDVKIMIDGFRETLIDQKMMVGKEFSFHNLNIFEDKVCWDDYEAGKIIFCEGYKAFQNPLFKSLPFVLSKGETLTIHSKALKIDKIINHGIHVLPLGEDLFYVGSTYDWDNVNELSTTEGRDKLEEQLKDILKVDYQVIEHKAGVRPTVKDRRPFLGLHTLYPSIGIFNGLGTKGVSLAPYFAKKYVDFLLHRSAIPPEVDIMRLSG
ncbi:FAD-binding oxidoreductase [Candidatus Amoebophilus asiaticus]|nr:FAD-binding oxidoreductase [Candidatus Amoebophilus asiaticus]